MRTYDEAIEYSRHNPTELVEFKNLHSDGSTRCTGFFLNGEREGSFDFYSNSILQTSDVYNSSRLHTEHTRFRPDGSVISHFFGYSETPHGEYIWLNQYGAVLDHCFYNEGSHIKDLDELLDAERDEDFYVTLAMHGIDKEYTFSY